MIIRVGAFQLMQEPETGLGEGQRQFGRAWLGDEQQPALGRVRRVRARSASTGDVEDGAEGEFAPHADADLSGQPGGQQGVAAEMKEVIGQTGALDAE